MARYQLMRRDDLAINDFGWDKGVIVHHLCKHPTGQPQSNLALIEKGSKFHCT